MNIISSAGVDISVPLAVGGTAAIYRVYSFSNIVAKIYNDPNKVSVEKLRHLQNLALSAPNNQLGLPIALINKNDKIIGYTQSYFEIDEYITLDNWIEQTLAARLDAEHRDLRFRLNILKSLAYVISELHRIHLCVVDLKPANILVHKKLGTVSIIDCDSFCVLNNERKIVFPAKEVTLGYFEPDSLKANKQISELSYTQDYYAYGVIAFQLLNNGIHPFQGVWKIDLADYNLETLSKQGVFPYAKEASPTAKPLAISVHNSFPAPIRTLFDRTFVDGQRRVAIRNWINVLDAIDKLDLLETCGNSQLIVHSKFKEHTCGSCYLDQQLVTTGRVDKNLQLPHLSKATRIDVNAPHAQGIGSNYNLWLGILCAVIIIPLLGFVLQEYQSSLERTAPITGINSTSIDTSTASNATSSSNSADISAANADNKLICDRALSGTRSTWAWQQEYQPYVYEAKRRNLSIDKCRDIIGMASFEAHDANTSRQSELETRVEETSKKTFKGYGNRDIDGPDISHSRVSSVDECERLCLRNGSCVGFVFDKWNTYCVLKSQALRLRGEPKSDSYVIDTTIPPDSEKSFRVDQVDNKKFFVSPYKTITVSSKNSCIRECENDKNCWAANFTKVSGRCELLDRIDYAYQDSKGTSVFVFRQ
jgi:serine/threonine protein kinase